MVSATVPYCVNCKFVQRDDRGNAVSDPVCGHVLSAPVSVDVVTGVSTVGAQRSCAVMRAVVNSGYLPSGCGPTGQLFVKM